MSEYIASLQTSLDTTKAKSEFESFKTNIQNDVIKISIDADFKGSNANFLNNFSKQMQSSAQSVGQVSSRAFGNSFNKGIKSFKFNNFDVSSTIDRLISKGVPSSLTSEVQKRMNALVKDGIDIKKIIPKFTDKDGLVELKISGVDKLGQAVTVIDKLDAKTKSFKTTTSQTINLGKTTKEVDNVSSKLLTLDEIKTRLFSAKGNVGSLSAKFGDVDKFSREFNDLGTSIDNALNQVGTGSVEKLSPTLAQIEGRVKTLTAETREWNKVNQTATDSQAATQKQLEATAKYTDKQKELQASLSTLKKQNIGLFDVESKNFSSAIVDEFNNVEKAINNISSVSDSKIANSLFSGLKASIKNASEEIKTETTSITSDIDKIQKKFDASEYSFDVINDKFKKSSASELGTTGYQQIEQYINSATQAQQRFNVEIQKGEEANLNQLNADMKEFTSYTTKATNAFNKLSSSASATDQQNLYNQIIKWGNENTKAVNAGKSTWDSITGSFTGDLTTGQLEDITSKFKSFKLEMEATGNTGRSFFHELGRGFKQIAQFAETYGAIQKVQELIIDSVNELKEVDSILTEISKTSDLTTSELKELGATAFDSASEFGKSATDYLTGIQEMSRSGFYGEQAEELARLSILGQAAGDMTADVSNAYLLATNAAYQYNGSVEKLNATLDGQNMISKIVMLYGNIWLHSWLLSWKAQRWVIGRISY